MKISIAFILLLVGLSSNLAAALNLNKEQAELVGQKIWQNEGAGRIDYLTVWNQGEDFPSLGIGHFIWYPEGVEGPFVESFPALRDELLRHQWALPDWLVVADDSPWQSREQFYEAFDTPRMVELRQLMVDSIPQQVELIIKRMQQALPKMLASLPDEMQRQQVQQQFDLVLAQSNGPYALIDYVNFKGEGVAESERYQGEGWGLLQVLLGMDSESPSVMQAFAESADRVLTRRVANAPRDESRWLPGWRKRLQTYTAPP